MKHFLRSLLAVALLAGVVSSASARDAEVAPKTLIHVVTVSWTPEATEAQINSALQGVHTLAKNFDGITRVWTRTVKAQGNRTHAIVMEFKSEQALEEYAGSPAQQEWYKLYRPIRAGSTTFDITN
jgi:uncharacterized protein (DUF1330 family)